VDVVRLSLAAGNRDGEWLRIRRHGFVVVMGLAVPELARIVDLADLSETLGRAVLGLWAASD
jgi:hypothetical protein